MKASLPRPRALLLDMGGVLLRNPGTDGLVGSIEDHRGRQALRRRLHDSGVRVGLDALDEELFGPWLQEHRRRHERGSEERWEPHFRRLRRRHGVRGRTRDLLAVWFAPYGDGLRAADGAATALAQLRRAGLRLALVSNVPLPGALYARVLRREGLLPWLDDLRFSYDEGSRKPSPAMLRAALETLGVRPEEAWMVGDRARADIAAGRSAGTVTVWVAGSERPPREADARVAHVGELPALVAAAGAGIAGGR